MKLVAIAIALTLIHRGAGALDLDHVVTPETIFAFRETLSFTSEQESRLKDIFATARSGADTLEKEVRREEAALNELLRGQNLEPGAAEAKFKALLAAEENLKLFQFRTLMELRGVLTPEQLSKAVSLGKQSRESNAPLMASLEEKAMRLKTAFDDLGIKPAAELLAEGERIRGLIQDGDLGPADEALDALGKKVGIDESPDEATIDFSQQDPGATDLGSLESRFRNVEAAVQKVTYLPKLRQLLQARDALEVAKAAEDAESVGRVLTWAENLLDLPSAP